MNERRRNQHWIENVLRSLRTAVLLLLVAGPSAAGTIHVPGDAGSIQAGLDAAAAGDTVVVACGTYREHSIAMKPGVCLTSETGGSECVTIDAEQNGHVLYCGPTDLPTKIIGFTITGGQATDGGGIVCASSSLVIEACAFVTNYAHAYGGGLYCTGCSPSVRDCSFDGNAGITGGGGVCCSGYSSPTLTDCVFRGNVSYHGGGVCCHTYSSPALSGCTFAENEAVSGGGVYCGLGCSPTLTSCTIEGNILHDAGQGSGLYCSSTSAPTLVQCILAFGQSGEAIFCDGGDSDVELRCTDVYGNDGGNWVGCIAQQLAVYANLSEDPLFCDAPNGDLTLDAGSPCAPENNPSCWLIGAWGVGCDSPVRSEHWGSIKAIYR